MQQAIVMSTDLNWIQSWAPAKKASASPSG